MPLSNEQLQDAVELVRTHGSIREAARQSGMVYGTLHHRLKKASEKGLMGTDPVMEGYRISSISTQEDSDGNITQRSIQQKPEHGEVFEVPEGHTIKGVSTLVNADGETIQSWIKTNNGIDPAERVRAIMDGLKDEIPRQPLLVKPPSVAPDILNQFTITDLHLGMLAWYEETGDADYDLKIAENLIISWFRLAIHLAPDADYAIFAQLGDFLHQDSYDPVTPASRHVLDSDSRFQKIIRAALRIMRTVNMMLLQKYLMVYNKIADANHDPASGAWMRECFAMYYENEPRLTVDTSADTYYAHEFGQNSLFYHHGHKKNIKDIDRVFVGKFREMHGRTKYSHAHIGHYHEDEVITTNLMKVERHSTLAPQDAYSAKGGFATGRSAKVISYHREYGEVGRNVITPAMVAGMPLAAANDNTPVQGMKNAA